MKFTNLLEAQTAKITKGNESKKEELKTIQTVSDIKDKWCYSNLLTRAAAAKKWDVEALKSYLIKRIEQKEAAEIKKASERLQTVAEATRQISGLSISVEWVKNRTWGNCPKAEIKVSFTDGQCRIYESSRITGCGYDKESTAIAKALNQCNELLHIMYTAKESRPTDNNSDIFGYGSGCGINPYFEGGVGVSCYPRIFEKLGYKWASVSSGKTFDIYSVEAANKG